MDTFMSRFNDSRTQTTQTSDLLKTASSHGFDHLSQVTPVVDQLCALIHELRITVRSKFPAEQIRRCIFDSNTI